jgi:hypothetical protein
MEVTIMDMYQHVQKEIESCNAMQIQDGELFCSIQWNGSYWEKVAGEMPAGQAPKGFTSSNLTQFLCKMPHESRRKGTVLLITGIPLSKIIGA